MQREEAPAAMEAWVEGSSQRRRDGAPMPVEVRGETQMQHCNSLRVTAGGVASARFPPT